MTFEMIGRISMPKETDNFHPWTESQSRSGWITRRLKFNIICGDSRHMLTIEGGTYADERQEIYTYGRDEWKNGELIRGDKLRIPFRDRLKQENIDKVADFRKYIVDLERRGRRQKLRLLANRLDEGGTFTEKELDEVGLSPSDDIREALARSEEKRHEFISPWDFTMCVKKLITDGEYRNERFYISGESDYQYSKEKQTFYENYVPRRIYLAGEDEAEKSEANIRLLFGSESFDDSYAEDNKAYYINGWTMEYERWMKRRVPVPVRVTLPIEDGTERGRRRTEKLRERFTSAGGSEITEYGVTVDMIDGAERKEITLDDLTDEQKEEIDLGLYTFEDISKELGGGVYGDRKREYRFKKLMRGYSKGPEETAYTADMMTIDNEEDDEEDLFD